MDAYADALGVAEPQAAPQAGPKAGAGNPALMQGRDDLVKTLEGLQSTLADAKEGSGLHQRTLRDIKAVQEQLGKMPGAPAAAPVTAAPKADPYADALGLGNAPAPAASAPAKAAPVPAAPRPLTTGTVAGKDGAAYSTDPTTDLTAGIVSGMAAPVAAGLHGGAKFLWELVKGNGVDNAVNAGADAVRSTQDALTYRPRTELGAKMSEQFGSNANPANWIPRATAYAGERAGDALADAGLPAAGAIVQGVGAAAPVAIGSQLPKVVPAGARMLSDMVKPQEVARVAEPTLQAKPRYRLGPDGQPVLLDQPLPQPGSSGGAAVAVPAAPAPFAAPVAIPRPTLAEASPELQKVVQQRETSGKPINKDVLSRHLDADTLPVKIKLTEGQATMDPDVISMEMNGRGKAKPTVPAEFYNQQGKALAQNLDQVRENAAPNATGTNQVEHGQILVDEYKAMDAAKRADIAAKYKALEDANGGHLPLSGGDFVTAADASLAKINRARFLPGTVRDMLSEYREGGQMTFNDFENLRTILAAEGRKAARAGDGNAEAAISNVRETLESLPMSGEAANIKPLADAARKAAKERFDRIKADPAYKAVANDDAPHGEPSPLADKFVQNYVINGKGAHVKQMKANIGASAPANETITRASLDYLSDMAKADKETGKFLSDRYNAGLRQLGPKMDDVFDPKTRQTVEQIGRVSKYTTAQPKGSYVNNSNTFVGAAADATKNTLEGVANNAAFGVPIGTFVRKGLQNRAESKAAKRSTAPGAGIDSTD